MEYYSALLVAIALAVTDPSLPQSCAADPTHVLCGVDAARENRIAINRKVLSWLARHQAPDGSWHYSVPAHLSEGRAHPTEATALVLTVMASCGNTPLTPSPIGVSMKKGVDFLLAQQRSSPGGNDYSGKDNVMAAHGMATVAVADICGAVEQSRLRESLRLAADYIVARQDARTGGWAAEAGKTADLETTYRQLAALHAVDSSLPRPACRDAAHKSSRYLLTLKTSNPPERHSEFDFTAETMAVICQMSVTGQRDNKAWERTAKMVLARGPAKDNALYNYYATQLIFDWEGEGSWVMWDKWHRAIRQQLSASQVTEGDDAGSWPSGDPTSLAGDRLYRTALNTLTLQVLARHGQRHFCFR